LAFIGHVMQPNTAKEAFLCGATWEGSALALVIPTAKRRSRT
jgi:hypothetical protein